MQEIETDVEVMPVVTTMLNINISLATSMDYSTNHSDMNTNGFDMPPKEIPLSNSLDPLHIERFMNGIMAIVIIALGLVGNTLTVIVLTRRTMRSSTNCYLTALAIWDGFVLIGTLILITIPQLSESFRHHAFAYVAVYIYPFALVAQTATLWLTVSFTVERYIAVCHPLKAAQMCTIARARMVIIFVSITSFLFNLSRWFDYRIDYDKDNATNATIIIHNSTEFGGNKIYHKVYFFGLYLFVMFFIPLLALAVINTFLVLAVKQSKKQRIDMNVRQHRENNVTIMLVSVVIVFIICQVPALVYNVAYAVDMESVQSLFGWKVLSTFRNFMVTFNSAINFILYCAFGQKFRRTFMKTFCQRCLRSEDFNAFTYPQSTVLASMTLGNSKYRVLRGKKNPQLEMTDLTCASNATHTTLLSKYSPQTSKTTTPIHKIKYENGKFNNTITKRNGELLKEGYGSEIEDVQEVCDILKTPFSSGAPSPVL
ncbi:FMRFamide receptor-like [Ylistrum balloti]|uniref:FMRFamide receptor-like n=1 Tax=Ylistrum balloti TaxID=509963 RepID=UPI002905A198|nr:FMRFamide receptor-like [Ylistrum balloti]